MPYAPRPTAIFPASTTSSSAAARQSGSNAHTASQQSSALAARIAAKRTELENLRQLRDLSGSLATQMLALQDKLATLRDGTEAVACVLANWEHVLRAISMASMKVPKPVTTDSDGDGDGDGSGNGNGGDGRGGNGLTGEQGGDQQQQQQQQQQQLPVTLVRIPVQSQDGRAGEAGATVEATGAA